MRRARHFSLTSFLLVAALAVIGAVLPQAASAQSTTRRPLALDLSGLRGVPQASLDVAPVVPRATDIAPTTYIAREGDTVRSVGRTTGVGGNAIIRANGLVAPYALHFGQSLLVPGGRYHRVAAGETGIAIALAYGVAWSRIVDANDLVEPYALSAGQYLVLPGTKRAASRTASIEQRAASFQISIDDLATGTDPARAAPWTPRQAVVAPTVSGAAPAAFAWPAEGRVVARFGSQGRGRVNQGLDLDAAPGALVRAAARGDVAYVGTVPGYGGLILVRHAGGWISAYARVDSAAVTKGARVVPGQPLGRVGNDMLHFELRRSRVAVDPQRFLPRR